MGFGLGLRIGKDLTELGPPKPKTVCILFLVGGPGGGGLFTSLGPPH